MPPIEAPTTCAESTPAASSTETASAAIPAIVSGPETYDGRDFYMADNGFEVGWVGAEAKGEVVLAPAAPSCPPVIDVTELAYMTTLERHLCVSGQVSLAPVQAKHLDLDPMWSQIEARPAWLAAGTEFAS